MILVRKVCHLPLPALRKGQQLATSCFKGRNPCQYPLDITWSLDGFSLDRKARSAGHTMSYVVFLTFSWVQIHQRSPVSQPALSDFLGWWMAVSARVAHILQLQPLCPSVTGEKTTKTCSKKTSQSPSHSLATMSMILPPTPWWLWVSLGPMEGHGTC